MPQIFSISLNIQTTIWRDSGTDGDVYLGVCGREFYADSAADDFERGSARTYIFGEGANVTTPPANDPRDQRLFTENVERLPVCIRFQPTSRTDHWNIQLARVTFNEEFSPLWETASVLIPRNGIWLGTRSGMYLHLLMHED